LYFEKHIQNVNKKGKVKKDWIEYRLKLTILTTEPTLPATIVFYIINVTVTKEEGIKAEPDPMKALLLLVYYKVKCLGHYQTCAPKLLDACS